MTAEVSKMAAHSATVAWRKRGHSESGIMCRGNSSPRVIRVTVKPVNSDLQKHTFAVIFSQVWLKSSSHSSWHRHAGFPLFSPNVIVNLLLQQHLRIHISPHVFFIFHSCGRNPLSWIIHSGPTNGTRWILEPRTLCWWLIRPFKCSFSCLIA